MSQAIRGGILAAIATVVILAGVAGWALIQKKNAEDKNINLQDQITESQKKQEKILSDFKKIQQKADDLQQRLTESKKQYDQAQGANDELKRKADDLSAQVDQFNQERDSLKNRIETMRKERDELMSKLKNAPEKIVYKDRPVESAPAVVQTVVPSSGGNNDEYWAGILKEKNEIQVQLDKAKTELNNDALQVADLRKQTSELQLQIKDLSNSKDEIERRLTNEKKALMDNFTKEKQDLLRKVKDGEDLASNLSMEVVRSRGDQKNANDFVGKVKQDNAQLQSQVRQLVATKVALEKTVARLTEQKSEVSKKLSETEGVIQDRINEIWQIKNNLDQKISQIKDVNSNSKEMELSPIVVNGSGMDTKPVMAGMPLNQPHKVISINEKNNFVIIDYGESQGSSIGRILKAFRDNKEIATLEVIQVRRDISAADIKDAKTKLQVGDQIR